MEQPLKQLAERYFGREIPEPEYSEAVISARRKLAWIINREGDAGGERQKPYYLAQLVSEAVRASRLSEYTQRVYELSQYMKEHEAEIIEEIKKGRPVPLTQDRPVNGISIVSLKS